jgi:hypothetical protein
MKQEEAVRRRKVMTMERDEVAALGIGEGIWRMRWQKGIFGKFWYLMYNVISPLSHPNCSSLFLCLCKWGCVCV